MLCAVFAVSHYGFLYFASGNVTIFQWVCGDWRVHVFCRGGGSVEVTEILYQHIL